MRLRASFGPWKTRNFGFAKCGGLITYSAGRKQEARGAKAEPRRYFFCPSRGCDISVAHPCPLAARALSVLGRIRTCDGTGGSWSVASMVRRCSIGSSFEMTKRPKRQLLDMTIRESTHFPRSLACFASWRMRLPYTRNARIIGVHY